MKTNNCRELACSALWASRTAACGGGPGFATQRIAALVLAIAGLTAPMHSAVACGFHDPSSINLGMLNLAYPDALHVRTAVWQAQLAGQLPPVEVAPTLRSAVGNIAGDDSPARSRAGSRCAARRH